MALTLSQTQFAQSPCPSLWVQPQSSGLWVGGTHGGVGPATESVLPLMEVMDWKGWSATSLNLLLMMLGWGQTFLIAGAAVFSQAHKQQGGSVFSRAFLAVP